MTPGGSYCIVCTRAIAPGTPVLFRPTGMVHLACHGRAPAGPLVLNVEDRHEARYVRSRVLRAAGFDVLETGWGEEAIRLAEAKHPAVVLLDVKLPDLDGFEVCRRIRGSTPVPVLMISALLTEDWCLREGLRSGASRYLVEPVDLRTLVESVRALVTAAS